MSDPIELQAKLSGLALSLQDASSDDSQWQSVVSVSQSLADILRVRDGPGMLARPLFIPSRTNPS